MNHAMLGEPGGGSGAGERGTSDGGCHHSHCVHSASEALAAARSHAHDTACSSGTGSGPIAGLAPPPVHAAGAEDGIAANFGTSYSVSRM